MDEWLVDFKFLIPIIPEKNGNKACALYFDGEIFLAEQGLGGNWMAEANGTFSTAHAVQAAGWLFHE